MTFSLTELLFPFTLFGTWLSFWWGVKYIAYKIRYEHLLQMIEGWQCLNREYGYEAQPLDDFALFWKGKTVFHNACYEDVQADLVCLEYQVEERLKANQEKEETSHQKTNTVQAKREDTRDTALAVDRGSSRQSAEANPAPTNSGI